jgi:anaerobic C4-dicarboxylate transporter DcuA
VRAFQLTAGEIEGAFTGAGISALFVLPTYPTLLVQMDNTGTTQIGEYVFNHPFLVPEIINIMIAVMLGFLFGSSIL